MGLFVILPDRAAWIATEVILFSAIAVGMYVFLRALKLSTVACVLAAATFAFAGPVLSQVNHVDMTEGYVAIPWMLLAVLHIVRDGRWRWSILLGIAFATVILGGAPEAMLDEALLVLVFAALSAGLSRQHWWRVLSRCAAGAAPGALARRDPVASWPRGHPQLTARERRVGGRGQLSHAVQHLLARAVPRRRLRPSRARPSSSASTTCPKSASISACCPSSLSLTVLAPALAEPARGP